LDGTSPSARIDQPARSPPCRRDIQNSPLFRRGPRGGPKKVGCKRKELEMENRKICKQKRNKK